ncbi:MAG: ATP-binding protein [Cyclobacteriaceae bacterium]
MESTTYLTMGLIFLGSLILLFAIARTHEVFRLLTIRKFRNNWRNLFILMAFFFVGYLGVIYIVYVGKEDLLFVLTGVIFFFGAVFVLLVVLAGSGTFKKLQEVNKGLERKVAQLKIQNEEMRQFNYATSHDLKEPLNTMITSVSLLEETYADKLDSTASRMIMYAVKAADRMRDLIDSLSLYLTVGRERQFKETDLNSLANEVIEEMQGSILETKATIEYSGLPTLNVIDIDVKRIFQNLIGNAIKYRKPNIDPEIKINASLNKKEKMWTFSVTDNGIGINEGQYKKIFQIFKQLHGKDVYEGMGIGLSICKKVVELHGGSIWPESKEGEGTTFHFTLKAG